MSLYTVQTFYFFKPLPEEQLFSIRAWLMSRAETNGVLGLIILGTEGFNTTLAARNEEGLKVFVKEIKEFFSVDFLIKQSASDKAPFRKFVVKIRQEIVTLDRPEIVPNTTEHRHLSPQEWHQMLERDDVVVVDTRNDYEIEIGTFKNAIDLKIKEFTEFPQKMEALGTDKDKPHMIFCTGGIRCEKAIYELENQGYKNVYQLDGGILNYMEQIPDGHWEGECFVFDSRVAVNKELKPSTQYSLCPQCGEVGSLPTNCLKCDESTKLCKNCAEIAEEQKEYQTCSKNCRYHYKRDPKSKGPQQKQFYHN